MLSRFALANDKPRPAETEKKKKSNFLFQIEPTWIDDRADHVNGVVIELGHFERTVRRQINQFLSIEQIEITFFSHFETSHRSILMETSLKFLSNFSVDRHVTERDERWRMKEFDVAEEIFDLIDNSWNWFRSSVRNLKENARIQWRWAKRISDIDFARPRNHNRLERVHWAKLRLLILCHETNVPSDFRWLDEISSCTRDNC